MTSIVAERLLEALRNKDRDGEDNADALREWNDSVEKVFASAASATDAATARATSVAALEEFALPTSPTEEGEGNDEASTSLSRETCRQLSQLLLDSVRENGCLLRSLPTTDILTVTEQAKVLLRQWKKEDQEEGHRRHDGRHLIQVLRANKNRLRWYLQVERENEPRSYVKSNGDNGTGDTTVVSSSDKILNDTLTSPGMMELYLMLTARLVRASSADNNEAARQASLLFFYATFHYLASSGGASKLDETYHFFVDKLRIFPTLLTLLLQARTAGLVLSLGKNLHNVIASFPQAAKDAKDTRVEVKDAVVEESTTGRPGENDSQRSLAPWAPSEGSASYEPVLRDCILWALKDVQPEFPGESDDCRVELVVELLRTLYALQSGSNLTTDERLSRMVLQILNLNSNNKMAFECQLALMPLLMDAKPSFAMELLQQDEALLPVLRFFEVQVSSVVSDPKRIDNSSASSILPILVVLYKFCTADAMFRKVTKDYIFPRRQQEGAGQKKKSTLPQDAPPGTLRHNVWKLLAWPHSHVKRFAGELVWTLCDGDADEVIERMGMGNALPILQAKGVVQLPGSLAPS